MKRSALVLCLILLASPCWAQAVRKAIEQGNRDFVAAFTRGDAAAIGALYTEHATLMPPGAPMTHGRAAAQAFWQGTIQAGIKNVSLQTVSVAAHGAVAREIGRFAMDVPNQPQVTRVEGKYVVIWKKVAGRWQLDVDIWNSDK